MSGRPVQAGFKISQASNIPWLAEISNPALTKFPDQIFHISVRTEVVHDFNLHDIRTRILL